MKGLAKFQIEQMKRRDERVFILCQHLRSAIDILEQIASDPYQPPVQPTQEEVALATPASLAPTVLPPEKLAYTIKEASVAVGVGRTTIYKALANGELNAKKLGSRTLILSDALQRWLDSFPRARRRCEAPMSEEFR